MARYAVGDIQGCYDDLMRLLDKIRFDSSKDQLWLAGDLVNRGPKSLEVLRFAASMKDSVVAVLGNHDLHLLAVAYGAQEIKRKDTLNPILDAPDAVELLHWLRHRPLLHYCEFSEWTMVHAGIPPQWSIKKARKRAAEVEAVIRSEQVEELLLNMYGNTPDLWNKKLQGMDRYRFIINGFTRMRYCRSDRSLDMGFNQAPHLAPAELIPWFKHPDRKKLKSPVVFGHWSTLGYQNESGVIALDTGCLWGGELTAIQLPSTKEEPPLTTFHLRCAGEMTPHS